MLAVVDEVDKKVSELVHKCDSRIITAVLFPFALVFNPGFIVLPILFVYYLTSNVLKYSKDDSLMLTAFYLVCVVANLVMTLTTKKLLNRKRPVFIPWLKHKSNIFRSKETNCSLPSGDSIQATNFAVILFYCFSKASLTGKMLSGIDQETFAKVLLAFVGLVMLARVYFMCHFFLDTFLGTMMAYVSTNLLITFIYPIVAKEAPSIIQKVLNLL